MITRSVWALLALLLLAALARPAAGCGDEEEEAPPEEPAEEPEPPPKEDPPPKEEPSETELIKKAIDNRGIDADSVEPYSNDAYYANEQPIEDGADLACDFSGDCCWGNDENGQDEFQWYTVGGVGDQGKFEKNFLNPPPPDSAPFLMAIGGEAETELWSARFVSCTVRCTDEPVTVTVNYWSTPDVIMDVCAQDTFTPSRVENPLVHCVRLPPPASPGPVNAVLPPGELFDIVIVARNMVSKKNVDLAIIDNISVDLKPCEEEEETDEVPVDEGPPTQPPPPPEPELPCNLDCDFDAGECDGWFDSMTGPSEVSDIAIQGLETNSGRFKNQVTGVRTGSDGTDTNPYLVSYLEEPGDTAIYETQEIDFGGPAVLRFKHYEATYDMHGEICFDNPGNCPFQTNPKADPSDREWRESSVDVPEGTKKIYLLLVNEGTNQGAFAIDDIQVLKQAAPGVPDAATEPACPPARRRRNQWAKWRRNRGRQ